MLEKNSIITITQNDKKYIVLNKEKRNDVVKVDFQYEDEFFFGVVQAISSNGNIVVKVKGIYNKDSEEDLT